MLTRQVMVSSNEETESIIAFSRLKVEELKKYLSDRGIQVSDGGRGKRKRELVELCEKAAEMKQPKLDEVPCGTKFLWVLIFANFLFFCFFFAIRKN